jgi:hypothetical protein
MNDEDQFRWLAHEATADLNLSEAKEQEFADILKELARQLKLSPGELMGEVQKRIPEPEDDKEGGSGKSDPWTTRFILAMPSMRIGTGTASSSSSTTTETSARFILSRKYSRP